MLKCNEDYLWQEYGIVKLADEDDMYSVPVMTVNSNEKRYWEKGDIERVYLPKLKDGCIVSLYINYEKDTLDIVSFIDGVPGMSEGRIVLRDDSDYISPYYPPNYVYRKINGYINSCDAKYDACANVAEKIRKKGYKDILVEFRMIFDSEEVNNWIKE